MHDPHLHAHAHASAGAAGKRLLLALLLTLGFSLVEMLAGFHSASLALLSDAAHMLTDSAALGLAAFAAWLARRPPSQRHTYGYGRVETLAALGNVLLMGVLVGGIGLAAVRRFLDPVAIDGQMVTVVAALGLVVNAGVALLLAKGEQTMNTRAALLHVIGDLLGSLAALLSGVIVLYTGWVMIDPLLSFLICLLLLASSLRLLRDVLPALMEAAPPHLSTVRIGQRLAALPGVISVHDLHVWTLSSNRVALSAHLRVESFEQWPQLLDKARHALAHEGIAHATLQPELPPDRAGQAHPVVWMPYSGHKQP